MGPIPSRIEPAHRSLQSKTIMAREHRLGRKFSVKLDLKSQFCERARGNGNLDPDLMRTTKRKTCIHPVPVAKSEWLVQSLAAGSSNARLVTRSSNFLKLSKCRMLCRGVKPTAPIAATATRLTQFEGSKLSAPDKVIRFNPDRPK